MFRLKKDDEIGAYLAALVKKSEFPSMRQFGKACLERQGESTDDTSVDLMSNRLAQIKKGSKRIQLEDLPVFSSLLHVTCEELLSAGSYIVPSAEYMTVRQFAASRDPKDWETFVQREDKPFLNCDEFGRNAIEYALEFKNYDLLKYLMKQGYIWFVDLDPSQYCGNFGAGTSIRRRDIRTMDRLDTDLRDPCGDCDRLRRQMISLALEHQDFQMLEKLKAREVPTLYRLEACGCYDAQLDRFHDEELITRIAESPDCVLDYFSQEFPIRERNQTAGENLYLFPDIGHVAELLIRQKHPCAEIVLKRCAAHNRRFLQGLEERIAAIRESLKESGQGCMQMTEEELYRQSLGRIFFFRREDSVISWCDPGNGGAVTNLISVDGKSDDFQLSSLIGDINESYQKVMDLTEKRA